MPEPNELQVGGDYYQVAYQPWDFTTDVFEGCFFRGNVNKYVTRHLKKNKQEDIAKAVHYLEKYTDLLAHSRLKLPVLCSFEANAALLAAYCKANDLGLAERDVLHLMMRGRFSLALEALKRILMEYSL